MLVMKFSPHISLPGGPVVGSRNYEHMSRVCGCVAVLLLCESALFRTILRNGCPVLGANGNLRGERRTSIRIRKKRMSDSSFFDRVWRIAYCVTNLRVLFYWENLSQTPTRPVARTHRKAGGEWNGA